jgi:hypothetical protein
VPVNREMCIACTMFAVTVSKAHNGWDRKGGIREEGGGLWRGSGFICNTRGCLDAGLGP